jgi:uncharacterized membrane protein
MEENDPMAEKKNTTNELQAEKKARVLGTAEKRRRLPWILIIVAGVIAAAAVFVLQKPGGNRYAAEEAGSPPGAAAITFPVAIFEDGRARHYEFSQDGLTIRYFILKSSDGVIRSAFDACDVCWQADKGYYQDGDVMVCRNCGRRFASVLVNEVQGGCNPAPLRRSIQGDQVVIQVQDILQGRAYFNFS